MPPMYTPSTTREDRLEVLTQLAEDFPFATVVTTAGGDVAISHVPVMVERVGDTCRALGHLARANAHWRALEDGHPTIVIFRGPHGYISPSWYETHPSVPTWNYVAVHLHGRPSVLDARGTDSILKKLVQKFEAGRREPWEGALPAEFLERELQAIVGFEMVAERIEGKFKLSQNKSDADREGTLAGLEREGDFRSRELAEFSRDYFSRKGGA
jgi:transcriptional regulator